MNRSTFRPMMKVAGIAVAASLFALVPACGSSSVNESKTYLANGNKFFGQKQWESAVAEYDKAIEKYRENHLAWFGKGAAMYEKKQFDSAAESLGNAVQLAPDQPVYQLVYGVSLYEKAVFDARKKQADAQGKKPEDISPDLNGVPFDEPLKHLLEAAKLNSDMWRAHYYLGRIYRETDKPKEAADEFSKALQTNPREAGPYVALGELYRKWDYTDQAIKVEQQAVANVCAAGGVCAESSDPWFVLGMGYDDKRQDKEAIDAFSKSLEGKKDNHKAKFQRGQAYFRSGDMISAKKDLEEFSKQGGASAEFNKQMASKMLMDIAAKAAGADHPAGGSGMKSPEDIVKGAKGGGPPPPKKK
jgi:tetratricopeptide (TPR) repeat protein